MNKGGKVMLVENSEGSRAEEFIPMIEEGGLRFVGVIQPSIDDIAYAAVITLRSGSVPSYLRYLPWNPHVIKYALRTGGFIYKISKKIENYLL